LDGRSILLVVLIGVWAARLGTFLFRRIHKAGKDVRFDVLKPSFIRFLNVWTIQGLWVSLTLAAALAAITTSTRVNLGAFALVGALIWVVFMNTGLWARSRHPNYFGEIVLWIGIAVIALPVLSGWQWVTLISPVFVFLLLTRVSGVPMLEKRADKEWGGQDEYEAYKERTPVLVPRLR
jgi:steroid 5-alpha reductase family enzyme